MMEHYHRLNATISDLIMGNTYKFRVFSENKCGISEEPAVTKDEAKILKTGETVIFSKLYSGTLTRVGPDIQASLVNSSRLVDFE